jgi:ATP-dependent Clp protease ATP-binding subunit ClpC
MDNWLSSLAQQFIFGRTDFAEEVTNAIFLAQQESSRLRHESVGTGQLLIGLILEGDGIAARTLSGLGVDLTEMRSEVERTIGFGSAKDITSDFTFTPRATHCSELSCVEARTQKSKLVRTEHLLLGIIRDGEGVGASALENIGVSLADIRVQVTRMIGEK